MNTRALSVRQPWAWAITDLDKRVENRTRKYSYQGELFLHASSWRPTGSDNPDGADGWFVELLTDEELALFRTEYARIPRGAIVGVARLCACQSSFLVGERPVITCLGNPARDEYARSQARWAEDGTWWLVLADVKKVPEPVPCRGMLGLWPVPADVEARVRAQL